MDALRLSQMALRAFAAVYGTLGILCVCASFVARRAVRDPQPRHRNGNHSRFGRWQLITTASDL